MNVFLIGSPLQLLNAIEAKHFFGFRNNHLILLTGLGYSHDMETYSRLIDLADWDSVQYARMQNVYREWRPGPLGRWQPKRLHEYGKLVRQFQNRRVLERIARKLRSAENLVVGNYLEHWEQYMRHFPNILKHRRLYLVDDGTDALVVNTERQLSRCSPASPGGAPGAMSLWKRARKQILRKFVDWNNCEAANLIFFTAYDLNTRAGDAMVKNNYTHLKKRLLASSRGTQVFILGQSVVEEEYLTRDAYYTYLERACAFYKGCEIIYIPHFRESSETVNFVQTHLKTRVERPSLPIEVYFATQTRMPKALASFFCSALANCALIYNNQFPITAFYIESRDLIKGHKTIEDIYDYLRTQECNGLQVINLSDADLNTDCGNLA